MHPNIHSDFILSPITDIIKNVLSASSGIDGGIETYPLCDYIMQSVFIKMTGFQEQKMKCICWELASVDYDYRRALLGNDDKLGECSSYSDKNKIYKRLVSQIIKYNHKFDITKDIRAQDILEETTSYIQKEFSNTNLSIWAQRAFNDFQRTSNKIKPEHFIRKSKEVTNLFETSLIDKYEVLYNSRNRIAHNTPSYQQNLPTLKTLVNPSYEFDNYFTYFTLLVLIDNIFIALYDKYLIAFDQCTN